MSAHELEPPKEERPGFTGVRLDELRPGMVVYRHGFACDPLDITSALCQYVFKRRCSDTAVELKRVPIGLVYWSQHTRNWYAHVAFLSYIYGRDPTPEYMVVSGLGLPDELMYEVYQYCD